MKDGDVIQVAQVVRDLDKAMKTFGAVIELGNAGKIRVPWRRYPTA
jgi:hypothetical protein